MKWNLITSVSIVLMLAYLIVANHIDLYPWNNLVTPQLSSTLAGVLPFSIYALAFAFGVRWLMFVGTIHSYVWLALQVRQWWTGSSREQAYRNDVLEARYHGNSSAWPHDRSGKAISSSHS